MRIDQELSEAVPGAVDRIHRMESLAAGRSFPFRMAYWVSALLGFLALSLAISGIYGVLSYLVAQRVREIGVRIALGATPSSVVGLVVGQIIRLAGAGVSLGMLVGIGVWKIALNRDACVERLRSGPVRGWCSNGAVRVHGCRYSSIAASFAAGCDERSSPRLTGGERHKRQPSDEFETCQLDVEAFWLTEFPEQSPGPRHAIELISY